MKKIREFLGDDMFNHIAMSGPDIDRYFDPNGGMTTEDKKKYAQGIICTYPFMMLGNYCRWRFDEEDPIPRPYEPFMEARLPEIQAECFPLLDRFYDEVSPASAAEKTQILTTLLTEIIPRKVIGGFYAYLYGEEKLEEYLDLLSPMLRGVVADLLLPAVFDESRPMDYRTRTEIFRFIALRLAAFCMKRMYDWMYGPETLEMGPPPGEEH